MLNNMAFDTLMLASGYCIWAFIISCHIVLIFAFFVNRNAKQWKLLYGLNSFFIVLVYLPIYEGHQGWEYHRHLIWGMFLHFH